MSYARFGETPNEQGLETEESGSDVYVFLSVYGWLECCGCNFAPAENRFYSTDEMLLHLDRHREAGTPDPGEVRPQLEEDRAESDPWIAAERAK